MSDLRIKTYVLGIIGTDCYLIYNNKSKEAVVIDPADNSAYLIKMCTEMGLTPKAILLTHGHGDHILAAEALRRSWNCQIYANRDEAELLKDPALNLSQSMGMNSTSLIADCLVKDQEELSLIGYTWKVIATPGHTSGSACYYIESEGVLFAGDTLFLESVGRTDLPTGSWPQLVHSVQEKLLILPQHTMVYPGHGDPTTIAHERQYNPVAVYKA